MSDAGSQPNDVFDVERIRRMVELMKDHDLHEIDLQQESQRIRLRRRDPAQQAIQYAPPAPAAPAAPPAAAAPPAPSAPAAEEPAASEHIVVVTSPMVGTYYNKPNPEAETFVKVGDRVDPETTVCIIEAMKVFNEIPADVSGKIVAIMVNNEEPVEFGKPLMKVDTRG